MKCRILLVEDDNDVREAIQQLLQLEGFNVTSSVNGAEALTQLHDTRPACLILLDLMMPVMNGWEFLDVRAREKDLSSIPVVVVSATNEPLKPGTAVAGRMRKPLDVDELLQVCHRYCNGSCRSEARDSLTSHPASNADTLM